jgi:hypothetical protein
MDGKKKSQKKNSQTVIHRQIITPATFTSPGPRDVNRLVDKRALFVRPYRSSIDGLQSIASWLADSRLDILGRGSLALTPEAYATDSREGEEDAVISSALFPKHNVKNQ